MRDMNEPLEALFARYVTGVEAEAEYFFHAEVKPFCLERGWSFMAGNGTHGFYNPKGKNHNERHVYAPHYPDDEKLQQIEAVLNLGPEGLSHNSFGSLMPCFKHPNDSRE